MKRATGIALAVALALGTAAVIAQPSGMGGGMMGGGMMGGGPGAGMMGGGMMGGGPGAGMMGGGMMGGGMMGGPGYSVEDRLSAQKAALKITSEQERAWTAYADVATKQFDAMRTQHETMWKSAPASSAERYELHSKLMKQGAERHEALSAAYKDLYAVLTPEQRALADQRGGYGMRRQSAPAR